MFNLNNHLHSLRSRSSSDIAAAKSLGFLRFCAIVSSFVCTISLPLGGSIPGEGLSASAAAQSISTTRPRAIDLGLKVGMLPAGPLDAITDVDGVKVGHTVEALPIEKTVEILKAHRVIK